MTLRHRIRLYQQLAVLARAGVPLRSSLDAQEQMTQWAPKILYFLILVLVGVQIVFTALDLWQQNVTGPLNDALNQTDQP